MIKIGLVKGGILGAIMTFLVAKRALYRNHAWLERKDITLLGRFGISHIDATSFPIFFTSVQTEIWIAAATMEADWQARGRRTAPQVHRQPTPALIRFQHKDEPSQQHRKVTFFKRGFSTDSLEGRITKWLELES
jgi:hypothetical protein